jgi:heme oxygenase
MFDLLRHSTRESSTALEKTFITRLKDLRTLEDYAALLATLHDFYAPVEKLVLLHLDDSVLPDLEERRKVKSLLRDMEFLNKKQTTRQPALLPKITNLSTAMGAMYVTEGSTLGGHIITGMLNKQLGMESGFSFFLCYGAEADARWTDFRQSLITHQHKFNITEVCQSAHQTFESLQQCLQTN